MLEVDPLTEYFTGEESYGEVGIVGLLTKLYHSAFSEKKPIK